MYGVDLSDSVEEIEETNTHQLKYTVEQQPDLIHAAQKMKFSVKNFLVYPKKTPQKTASLFTFTKEILNEKFHFLCNFTYTFMV